MKKEIYILLISITSLTFTSYGQQSGWVWQNPLPQGNDAYDIKMFNSGTGYCRTDYCILKTTNQGNNWQIILTVDYGITDIDFLNELTGYYTKGRWIYKTTNGGSSWPVLSIYTDFYPNQMKWLNELTGFAMQSRSYSGTILNKTTNGGLEWFTVFNDTSIFIRAMSFPSNSMGYLAGITRLSVTRNAKFLKTTTGGSNWDSITIPSIFELTTVHFVNDLSGYITGPRILINGPNMLRTSNGGVTWDSLCFDITNFFNKLDFVNFNTGYGFKPYLKKTTDAGANWIDLTPFTGTVFYPIDFSIMGNQNIYLTGRKGKIGKTSNGGINWEVISSGFYGNLNCIRFFDANTGIATGGLYGGACLRTTNAGLSWDTNTIDRNFLENIFLLNSNTGYLACTGAIFKTTDKGISFTRYPTLTQTRWDDVCFPNENTGYTINKYSRIDKTTDGGNSWVNILNTGYGEYFTICFINGNTGFYGGSRIYRTTNGGISWDTLMSGLSAYSFCNKIKYIDGILYSIGWTNSQYRGFVMKSTNEGINWQIDSTFNESINDISVPLPNTIYLIGDYNYVYKSINNFPWQKFNIFTYAGYSSSICFVNKDSGFVSTEYGGIIKTTNGGGTPIGILPGQNEIPASFSLSQNYPNPFNPVTIISYSLPKNTLVSIKIYDILGRLVKQLVNENQSPGRYSVSFDGTDFANGVYFYTIETPDFTQSKKMVLLK